MKTQIELTVEAREAGKHNSRTLRKNKMVPAVIYGATKPTNVFVQEKDIVKYNTRAYENALFKLKSGDKNANGHVVLMKDVDVQALSRRPQHVDFFAIDLTKTVRVFVEVRLAGKAIGLSEGGVLNVVTRQVEVECLPTEIPEFFTADVSGLGVGDAFHVSSLEVPKGIKIHTGAEQTLATVSLQEAEEVATPVAAAAAPAAAAGAKPAPGAAPAAAAGKAAPAAKAPAKK